MEAPEKIYLPREIDFVSVAILTKGKQDGDVEYTRTDAFMEKACAFLKDRIEHDSIDYPMATMSLISDFRKYIEE